MSRNLIAAKAWKSGREEVCKKCACFESKVEYLGYDWNNCQKKNDFDCFSMWDGKTCCYFVTKREGK